ncbi:ArsR/SmtB family transcription factor [Actinomadura sp. CNU-125]|uniref:ArsR/SmtB family transcription factor n=1 Tax=Actinomadura sp. CNU-125 TaxID=1904961 RepID=UPI0021CCDD03|nr:metalloregulator ArsR/SmtB family transcription factor [Actinomadura sp. CNU-125]
MTLTAQHQQPASGTDACHPPTPITLTPMPRSEAEERARTFKAVSDPTRVQILGMIEASPDGEACVCDLTTPLGLRQPTVSHHLKILTDAGLVTREKRGTWVWYAIVPERLDALRALLH